MINGVLLRVFGHGIYLMTEILKALNLRTVFDDGSVHIQSLSL